MGGPQRCFLLVWLRYSLYCAVNPVHACLPACNQPPTQPTWPPRSPLPHTAPQVFGTAFRRNARWSTNQPVPDLGDETLPMDKVGEGPAAGCGWAGVGVSDGAVQPQAVPAHAAQCTVLATRRCLA